MNKLIQHLWKMHEEFWFSSRSLLNLALMRIFLCGSLALLYFSRQFDVAQLYTDQGILKKSQALDIMPEYYRPIYLLAQWPDQFAGSLHLMLAIGLLLIALGIGNRFFIFLIWLLNLAFVQRNYSVVFGADLIGNIFLFLLAGTECCKELSLLNFIKQKLGLSKAHNESQISAHNSDTLFVNRIGGDSLTRLCYRLIQVQLCIIYVYTGIEKLKGASWWDGTALWTVLANPQMVIFDLTWVRYFPLVLIAITFITILFEIYFPFLVTHRTFKIPTLMFGLCFHFGIAALMALWGFAVIMISAYFLFLNSDDWQKIKCNSKGLS